MRARSEVVQMFERVGFTPVRRGQHQIWRCPCGHRQMVSPVTPGRGRAVANVQAEVKRVLRACTPMEKSA